MADDGAPPAMLVDMVPLVDAPETGPTETSPDRETVPESSAAEQTEGSELLEPELPKAVAALSHSPRPLRRPAPKATPAAPQNTAAQSKATSRSRAESVASVPSTTTRAADGRSLSAAPAQWQARVLAHIERRKPKPRGGYGATLVTFAIDDREQVQSARVARSSGSVRIDAAALGTVERASPLPPPPLDAPRTLTVSIAFVRP